MTSYTTYLFLVVLMCVVAVNAEGKYEFIKKKPLDYPKYEDDQYMELLKNVKFPNKAPSGNPVYKEHCDSNDVDRFCCSVSTSVRPFEVVTPKGLKKWVYQSTYFQQYIPETRCKTEGSKCFSDFEEVMKMRGLKPKCKTDRGYISLLVHDGKSNEKDFKWMTVPIDISCSCHLTK